MNDGQLEKCVGGREHLIRVSYAEAIIGLLIEITFIATFTQRFFAR